MKWVKINDRKINLDKFSHFQIAVDETNNKLHINIVSDAIYPILIMKIDEVENWFDNVKIEFNGVKDKINKGFSYEGVDMLDKWTYLESLTEYLEHHLKEFFNNRPTNGAMQGIHANYEEYGFTLVILEKTAFDMLNKMNNLKIIGEPYEILRNKYAFSKFGYGE